jgi:hypothetical protein
MAQMMANQEQDRGVMMKLVEKLGTPTLRVPGEDTDGG